MDLETASGGSMSNKKTPKDVFYGPAGGFFSQKKKAPLGNVKHSGDEKNIFLKSGSGASVYSDIESLSDNDEDVSMFGGFNGSLLDLAMNEKMKPLLPPLKNKVSLKKIWIDPKIIKTPVEVSIKKSFALDVNLLAVEGKSIMLKTQFIRKIFSKINGFRGTTTPSKFEGIIRSMFTSEKSMKKAVLLAGENEINVNSNLKKQRICLDQAIVIKEISMNMPKDMIIAAVAVFGEIKLIRVQLIGLWQKAVVEFTESSQADLLALKWLFLIRKNLVHVAKAVRDCNMAGGKTCIINQSLDTGNRVCCAVVGFELEENLDTAFHTEPIFGECNVLVMSSSKLSSSFKRSVSGFDYFWLAKLYVKKKVSIFCPAAFVSFDSSSGGSPFGSGLLSGGPPLSLGSSSPHVNKLGECLAVLEHSLEILSDQVSVILKKLSFIKLVPLASLSYASLLAVSVPSAPVVDSDMALNGMLASSAPPFLSGSESADGLSSSGSKILTSKIGGLKSKMSALEALFGSIMVRLNLLCSGSGFLIWKFATCNIRGINVPVKQANIVHWHMSSGNMVSFVAETKLRSFFGSWIKDKFDGVWIFTSGLDIGYLGAGIAVIMNNSLAHHVFRIEEIPGRLILIRLLFKGKLLVTILDLYAGASSGTRFAQTSAVNSFIAKAVNSSTFIVLGGNFNENDSGRSASFKFCLGLGLVNSFTGHLLVNMATWSNSRGVEKTIDFILVSRTLSSTVVKHCVNSVSDFFDMDHKSVMVSVGLGGLLNVWLNGLYKQANKDCWKFRIKNADDAKWSCYKVCSFAKILKIKKRFLGAAAGLDLDVMWSLLEKMVVDFVDEIFSRHWFCDFQCSKNEHSSKFLGLELLVVKIVKCLTSMDAFGFDHFVRKWSALNASKAFILEDMVYGGQKVEDLLSYLSLVRKEYRKSKMFKSKLLQEATIRKAIEKHIEQFCLDKGSMIRSVLDQPFQKVVLDYLVVDDELILEPEEVRSSVDKIMESWTQKYVMPMVLPNLWARQYTPLNYVRNDVFFSVMSAISMGELLLVINGLPDGKAAGLSGIPNKLWKHGCGEVLECLLVLLNVCLSVGMVSVFWKRPYDWNGVLTNTQPIVLIETARKFCLRFLFTVGLIVEDALEKNREIWLVLQDMQKAYNSVGWPYLRASLRCIKICERFIGFFGNIHEDRVNRMMTNFGLSDGYRRIFYDLLLCEVKRHEHLCEYCVDFKFVAKMGKVESMGGMMFYLTAGAFVNDTIWIENCQASTQYALNIASEVASLSICGQPILIAKKGEAHYYLSIFLSIEGLSKPSVSKAHFDVCFFVNVVLKKAITDKQSSYLVSAVLQPIVSYQTQFSFVLSGVYRKWDVMIRKGLKSKAGLSHDFPDAALHYSSLYGLKTFEQVQFEGKIAALVSFSNASGVLGCLFNYRFLDLQFPVKLCVSPVNNFLAGIVKIFLSNELFLANNLSNAFCSSGHFPLSSILGSSEYFNSVRSLKRFGFAFSNQLLDKRGHKRLDPWEPMPCWFLVTSKFMLVQSFSAFNSDVFSLVKDGLHDIWSGYFEVYTDRSLRNAGSVDAACDIVTYFLVLDKSIGVMISGLLSSTLAELQTIALALECVLSSCHVILHIDSQTAIDVCLLELSCAMPDFHNWCWLKRCHIFNLVKKKDLEMVWIKVKGHSGISGNVKTDLVAGKAVQSPFSLLAGVYEHYLVAENMTISDNACHFAGPGVSVIPVDLIKCIDWISTAKVWHPDSHILAKFTGRKTSNLCSYLIKAVHRHFPVAVQKKLYDKGYPSVLCLLCGKVEFFDHAFMCSWNVVIRNEVLVEASARWVSVAGLCDSLSSAVLRMLSACSLNVGLYSIVCKNFTQGLFDDKKQAISEVVNFVRFVADLHCVRAWLVRSKHRVWMEKTGLVADSGVVSGLSHNVSSILLGGVVRMLGVIELFAVNFGYYLLCCFFSGLSGVVSVIIGV
ncbi:hypothetical protein G9A89_017606 [Geosiphon pyriformis]|nr:hypothetical protein G9A89_017606 [Geosiphon pyriformis]